MYQPVQTAPTLSAGKRPVAQPPSRAGRDVHLIQGPAGHPLAVRAPMAHTSTVPQRPGVTPPPSVITPAPAGRAPRRLA